jgi:WD40 repeat protein
MHKLTGRTLSATFAVPLLFAGMAVPAQAQPGTDATVVSSFAIPPVLRVGWSPDESLVYGHAIDGTIRVWTADGGLPNVTLGDQQAVGPFAVVPTPDGERVAITGPEWSTVLAEARTLEEVWSVPKGGVPSSFSSDGSYLATGHYGVARILDASSGEVVAEYVVPERSQEYLDGHPDYDGDFFFQAEFLAGDRWVLLITRDASPRLWDWQSGEIVDLDFRTGDLAAAVSPDRIRFAIGGDAGWQLEGTRVWDAASFLAGDVAKPTVIQPSLPRTKNETVFAFTPDGEQVVSGWTTPPRLAPDVPPTEMYATFRAVATGDLVRQIPTGFVGGLKISADGQRMLKGGMQMELYDIGPRPQ